MLDPRMRSTMDDICNPTSFKQDQILDIWSLDWPTGHKPISSTVAKLS